MVAITHPYLITRDGMLCLCYKIFVIKAVIQYWLWLPLTYQTHCRSNMNLPLAKPYRLVWRDFFILVRSLNWSESVAYEMVDSHMVQLVVHLSESEISFRETPRQLTKSSKLIRWNSFHRLINILAIQSSY